MKPAQREAFPANMCNLTTEKRETCWSEKPLEDVEHLSQGDIQCHFNPSASPHFGGIWVKVRVRVSLRVRVREPLINNRPLTKVSSESGLEAITPNHFLTSCANPLLPCGVYSGKEISSKKRSRQKQVVVNQVLSRWLIECLPAQTEICHPTISALVIWPWLSTRKPKEEISPSLVSQGFFLGKMTQSLFMK